MSIIIGIDYGYYAIKTAHCSFPAGLTSYREHEPYTRQGLLEFGGCWFCPNASIRELRHVYDHHPNLWQKMLELQDVTGKTSECFSWGRTFRSFDERFRAEQAP